MNPEKSRRQVNAKNLFYPTLIIIPVTILAVWLSGAEIHRSLYHNAITSLSLLAAGLFIFLTYGLYYGFRLKDDIGKMTDRLKRSGIPDLSGFDFIDIPDGDSIIGSIFTWIAATIFIGVFLWFFGAFLWAGTVAFTAMLYWIYFRAMKMVFRKSTRCRNNLPVSTVYAFYYTVLYSCWIYGIILAVHYLAI